LGISPPQSTSSTTPLLHPPHRTICSTRLNHLPRATSRPQRFPFSFSFLRNTRHHHRTSEFPHSPSLFPPHRTVFLPVRVTATVTHSSGIHIGFIHIHTHSYLIFLGMARTDGLHLLFSFTTAT
jgi:hypothetical protein